MIDLTASVLLVGGAVLIALGGVGLVRFPDVLTRMHAATKAATVGVILTTVAGALEAGAPGGVLVLLLVVALLFLSGPLGMSMLARAAYHDPETPRTLAAHVRIPESTQPAPSTPAGRKTSYLLVGWLLAAWLAVFGSLAANVVAGGVLAAGGVAMMFRRLAPRWPRAMAHPVAASRFAVFFLGQMSVATWGVIKALFLPRARLRPAVIDIPLLVRNRTEVTLLMNAISFTPGTVALELEEHRLYVHVLDTDDPDAVAAAIRALEGRIMTMFGAESRSAA